MMRLVALIGLVPVALTSVLGCAPTLPRPSAAEGPPLQIQTMRANTPTESYWVAFDSRVDSARGVELFVVLVDEAGKRVGTLAGGRYPSTSAFVLG